MEIRCSECQHLGPAEVRPTAGGVALVCENCGHLNMLEVPAAAAGVEPASPPVLPDAIPSAVGSVDTSAESAWLKPGALEKLLPSAGTGPRCRKCAGLLDMSVGAPVLLLPGDVHQEEHCPRCGLSVVVGRGHAAGEAPWERAPDGREAEHEQASLLWKAVEESPTDENITKFANFARDERLLEFGIRCLRFFLVENPGHPRATQHLNELAQSFQSKVIIAQAQAQIRAGNVLEQTTKMKGVLLWTVFAIWTSVFLLFVSQFAGASGCG